ncbi:MAG TPA: hypothetical protein VIM57_01830 [Luteolibacter sp.]
MLSSCIDGREEYWLSRDGSGVADVIYEVPSKAVALKGGDSAVQRLIEDWIAGTAEVRREACEVVTTGDRTRIHVRLAFGSALKLFELSKSGSGPGSPSLPGAFQHLVGVFDLRLRGRDVEFTRTVSPGKAFLNGLLVPKHETDGRRLVYTLHLPEPALESNATQTSDGGKTLVWDRPLADGLKQPFVTYLKTRVPVPYWMIASSAALGMMVLLLIATKIRRFWTERTSR